MNKIDILDPLYLAPVFPRQGVSYGPVWMVFIAMLVRCRQVY